MDESSNQLSRLLKREPKWAYPPKTTEDHAGGNPDPLASNSNASIREVAEQRHEQKETEYDDGQQEAATVNPRVNDCMATLRHSRDTNAHVLKLIFELNEARAPMFQQTEDVVHTMQEIMHRISDFTKSVELPDALTTQLGELQRKFDLFRKGQFASFRADEARCAHLENDVVQSLYHSGRYLDGFLETNATGPTSLPESETTPIVAGEQDGLGKEPPERSPSDIQYLTKVGDREIVLEQLLDLRGEQKQLLEEQKSRAHFGLSLDEDSLRFLESFERQEQALLDELEYAELGLEAIKQLMIDDEALAISNEALAREPDEDQGALAYLERTSLSSQPSNLSTQREWQNPLYRGILRRKIRLSEHLRGPDTIPVEHGDFINTWLLHRLQFLPRLLSAYTSLTEAHYGEIEDDDLENLFLERWFDDSSAADFARYSMLADQQSVQENLAESEDLEQRSLSAVRIRPTSLPLLKMGPSTTTQDIIVQAMQAQGMSSSPMSDK